MRVEFKNGVLSVPVDSQEAKILSGFIKENNGMNKLGGSIFFYNPESMDYCWREAIKSLQGVCDEVVVLDCGSTDGSQELVKEFADDKTRVVCLPNKEWALMKGKEKLSHFANMCKNMLTTEWRLDIQADEVIDERSYGIIRAAIELDNEAYFCHRINLWGDSQHQLNVSDDRKPVGNKIIRLAKTKYFSVDDSEGIFAPASWLYWERIKIWHMGFVRNKYIHTNKIEYMLTKVFGMGMDEKVTAMNGVFDPFSNFSREDLIPIQEPLPKVVQEWAAERDRINDFKI